MTTRACRLPWRLAHPWASTQQGMQRQQRVPVLALPQQAQPHPWADQWGLRAPLKAPHGTEPETQQQPHKHQVSESAG